MMVKSGHIFTFQTEDFWKLKMWKNEQNEFPNAGHRIDRKEVDYSLQGSAASKIFRAFNALGTIAFSFGDAMLPEIQVNI